ncbi:MAG: NAD-dependent epimerase/dehydratase family protein [Candidatus Hydrogenedentota bacterium]
MRVLVTGGGGFLGKALVRKLLSQGHSVRSFSRGDYPELRELGVETISGDLSDYKAVHEAVRDCELVYHVGAKAGVWGRYDDYYATNVMGTQNIIEACLAQDVEYLVNTSSPSVIFDGHDQEGNDESTPYPKKYLAYYPQTKALAEQAVTQANSDQLKTVSLRPHLIWGPEDTQLIPRLVEQGRAGKLRLIGSGTKRIDAVYIDNAVDAHINAATQLMHGGKCAGKTYFITNDDPWPFEQIVNGILEAAGVAPVTRHVSPSLAYTAGGLLECVYRITGKTDEPRMTRFVARQLATAHWYDIAAAKDDLGYSPAVSMEEGLAQLKQWFEQKEEVS